MAKVELLNDCRNYFEKAQTSWVTYFAKWEVMAKNEEVKDGEGVAEEAEAEEKAPGKKKRTLTLKRRSRAVSVAKRRKGERFASTRGKRSLKNDQVHSRTGSRMEERGTEIIRTRENQTNLELESANDKHFEADLKAIFIEILSENANKFQIFSVLSKMLPGGGGGGGGGTRTFTLDSVTVERTEFSMGERAVEMSWASRGIVPVGGASPFPGRLSHGEQISAGWPAGQYLRGEESNSALARRGPFNRVDVRNLIARGDPPRVTLLLDECTSPTRPLRSDPETQLPRLPCINYRGGLDGNVRTPLRACESNAPARLLGPASLSPKETFLRIFPSPTLNPFGKCMSEQPARNRKRRLLDSSATDSDDDDGPREGRADSSGSFLKIFCTPKRPRRAIKYEESDGPRLTNDDNDDCFNVLDRVKTKNN